MSLKLRFILPAFLLSFILFSQNVFAHCPLCIAATGSTVAFARFYGVHDLITGTLFGGFIVSSAFWIHLVLKKRNKGQNYLPFQLFFIIFLSVLSLLISIYLFDSYGIFGYLFGLSDLTFGAIIGSIISTFAFEFHEISRRFNNNKNFIPFQSILLVLLFLSISIASYYVAGLI